MHGCLKDSGSSNRASALSENDLRCLKHTLAEDGSFFLHGPDAPSRYDKPIPLRIIPNFNASSRYRPLRVNLELRPATP